VAHKEQFNFCKTVKDLFPSMFTSKKVLEAGSYNVNGTIRDLFSNCDYTGLDIGPGPCVDVVCKAHEFESEPNSFDVVCSCEMFEHDKNIDKTLPSLIDKLKPGGLLFFTCASIGRREHGTLRSNDSKSSPHTCSDPELANYYRNLSEKDVREIVDFDSLFSKYVFQESNLGDPLKADLYFWGIKK
jgi:SAM-dependent methyltransferase